MVELQGDVEVLEFALSREVEAEQFYAELEGRVQNPTLRKVLEKLRKEEVVHRERLELELMKKGRVVPDAAEVGESEDRDEVVLIGEEITAAYREIIKTGIERERKSFRLYVELSSLIRDEPVRETLLVLAEEEAKHLALLEVEYNFITIKKK